MLFFPNAAHFQKETNCRQLGRSKRHPGRHLLHAASSTKRGEFAKNCGTKMPDGRMPGRRGRPFKTKLHQLVSLLPSFFLSEIFISHHSLSPTGVLITKGQNTISKNGHQHTFSPPLITLACSVISTSKERKLFFMFFKFLPGYRCEGSFCIPTWGKNHYWRNKAERELEREDQRDFKPFSPFFAKKRRGRVRMNMVKKLGPN